MIFFLLIIPILFLLAFWYSRMTNPLLEGKNIRPAFETKAGNDGEITIRKIHDIRFVNTPLAPFIMLMGSFFRIMGNAYFPEKPFLADEQQIIARIHHLWFAANKPYIISGANFPEFYVRDFGIFYGAVLDPRFFTSEKDWEMRQRTALQTVATLLELTRQAGREYTTFVPIWQDTYAANNINAEPSDSLFALFYTLLGLTDEGFIAANFPAKLKITCKLQTKSAAKSLVKQYETVLEKVTNDYLESVIDKKTGLVRKDILLSGARDQIKRQSSFYDNVIAWSTARMAMDLGLKIKPGNLESWKRKIIGAFWDDEAGIFLDDLSDESKKNHIFSGDAFIVVSTKFLDLADPDEREKLDREIAFVRQNNLDRPFPLHYATHNQPEKLYFVNKYFAGTYVGENIWSHWGMEYIKALILLSADHPEYLALAKEFLDKYKSNIEKYGGYPETYSKNGAIYRTLFYKSILHTGWVVNYEQTKMMLSKPLPCF